MQLPGQIVHLHLQLQQLSDRHRDALNWFVQRAGTDQFWPEPLISTEYGETRLVTQAKGIYKPQWSEYALSVRQVLSGPYPDGDPIHRPDDTWSYAYFQENKNVEDGEREFTNQGLMACWRDQVPIGVMRQVSAKSPVRYHVLGVALVAGWEGGYFFLEGFSPTGFSHPRGPRAEIDTIREQITREPGILDEPEPTDELDGRRRVVAEIVRREGQPEFRRSLVEAYRGRCAITGWDVVEALAATHILPYRGAATNHVSNGLLLRADIHALFGCGLLAIDERTMTVLIATQLSQTKYSVLAGTPVLMPDRMEDQPDTHALRQHRLWCSL